MLSVVQAYSHPPVTGVPNKMRTGHLQKTSLQFYRYINPFGPLRIKNEVWNPYREAKL